MGNRRSRYKEMELHMSLVLLIDLVLFILYLVAAGNGIIWLKVITAIIAMILSGLCLGFLYLSQELRKPRSLWMSTTAAAILVCILASLVLNFPSPNRYKLPKETEPAAQTQTIE